MAGAAGCDRKRAGREVPTEAAPAAVAEAPVTSASAFTAACQRGLPPDGVLLLVYAGRQCMDVVVNGQCVKRYSISTSRVGLGNQPGSQRTPRGLHRVAERVGEGEPLGREFVGRRPTARVFGADQWCKPDGDGVLSRILWLDGLECGLNQGGGVDSRSRYIYIHGTNQEHLLGQPASHGCIRMFNRDVVELFDFVKARETWCWIAPALPAPVA